MLNLDYDVFGNSVIYDILDEDKPSSYNPLPLHVPLPDSRIIPPGRESGLEREINPDKTPLIIDRNDDSDNNGRIILDM